MEIFSGNIVDPVSKRIYKGQIKVGDGVIKEINQKDDVNDVYILPGLVDSHIHIESSMLTPQNFSDAAIRFGTVATVSDPHEIANVLGEEGVNYMIENARDSQIKFFFGVPSCVPATGFESSGAKIDSKQVKNLLQRKDLYFLSEMMNYPGVIYQDPEVHRKINSAKEAGKRIDGHAPGLRGKDLDAYVKAGISTDHECFSLREAEEKLDKGMYIQIREGSAAKNFESLYSIIDKNPDKIMLCSDDLHPDDLVKGHINLLLKRCVEKKIDLFNAIRSVSVVPVNHYNINVGLLQVGDPADFILVNNLTEFQVLKTVIDGKIVFTRGDFPIKKKPQKLVNKFFVNEVHEENIKVPARGSKIKVIQIIDKELITKSIISDAKIENNCIISDVKNDILKIVVQNRYEKEPPSVGFIKGFELQKGGFVSSIAHDSHNIIAVGTEDRIITELIHWVNKNRGGIAVHTGQEIIGLNLPVAGIISDKPASEVAEMYLRLNNAAREMGCPLEAPFMTLSFMALLVIPELKIGNKGLFDVNHFKFTNLQLT